MDLVSRVFLRVWRNFLITENRGKLNMGVSNFKICGLSDIVRNKMYIPKYQRSYAWEKEEYTDLWEDLYYLVNDGKEMHFYGQIVVHKDTTDSNKFFIIDGQQRITTSFFLIRAFLDGFNFIYNKYKDKNSNEARKLARHIIEIEQLIGFNSNENYANQDLHLVQNDIDNDFFVKLMCLDEETLKSKLQVKTSTYRMKNAYNFFKQKIMQLIKPCPDILSMLETLDKYYKKFTESFKAMYLEDDNLGEAYTIFETLNDRGKELASTDLLKNYILANSINVDTSYKKWNTIVINLDSVDTTKFIRSVWNSNYSFAREKSLYSSITNEIQRSSMKAERFLDLLNDCSLFYHDMVEPTLPKQITSATLLESFKSLKIMKSSTWHPVLLSMYCKKNAFGQKQYSMENIAAVASALECYVFRNFMICQNNPNEAEVQFAKLATDISNKTIETPEIVRTIKSKIVKEEIFDTMFKTYTFKESDKDRIRYFFRKVHKYLDSIKEINIDNTEVHIEHIMPIEWKDCWPQCKDYHDEYLWKVGNLCLLSGPLNIEISNKDFEFKKETAYKESIIKPNNKLLDYKEWTDKEIIERQEYLLDIAKNIW
ncbi:MAG: DUF262 domain-containing HNH endonuclease family protein [Candidatus Enteromonas sp.]|nr:DUF262 domain-containing HNH endonuclease family protein [Candidatus Enteromonas sp.]